MYGLSYTVMVTMLNAWAARTARIEASLAAEKAMLCGERSGLRDLMELSCDVVVNMADDLRLSENASRLAAMVKLQGGGCLKGMRLQDFMPEESDKTRFEDCVAAMSRMAGETSSAAGVSGETHSATPRALHVKLRDGLGNLVKVELFCARIQTVLGTSFVVGLREFSDGIAELVERRRLEPKRVSRVRSVRQQDSSSASEGSLGREGRNDAAALECETEDSHSACSDSSARTPRLFPTTILGLEYALVRILLRTEVDMEQARDCCPLHSRLRLFREIAEGLSCLDCAPDFHAQERLQCQKCGFLNRDGRSGLRGLPRTPRDVACFACAEVLTRPGVGKTIAL